jgi:hypothetical protein
MERKLSFLCEPATTEQLAELARRGDRSLSAEIRRAVREHVELEVRAAFHNPARATPMSTAGAMRLHRPRDAHGGDAA